jgi:hypothetical protein
MMYGYLSIYVMIVFHVKVREGEIKLARPDLPSSLHIHHLPLTILPCLLPLLISQQAVHIKASATDWNQPKLVKCFKIK